MRRSARSASRSTKRRTCCSDRRPIRRWKARSGSPSWRRASMARSSRSNPGQSWWRWAVVPAFPEPRPIPVPTGLAAAAIGAPSISPAVMAASQPQMIPAQMVSAQMAEPVMRESTNITALRQQAAQPERVIIPDPMPYPETPAVEQRPAAAVQGGVPLPKQPSSLFAQSQGGHVPRQWRPPRCRASRWRGHCFSPRPDCSASARCRPRARKCPPCGGNRQRS